MAEYYESYEIPQKLRFMFYGDEIFSIYPGDSNNVKAGYPYWSCNDCQYFRVTINIPRGMYELLEQDPDRMSEVKQAFNRIIKKYLPVYAKLLDNDDEENVILSPDDLTIEVSAPPSALVIADVLYLHSGSVKTPNTGNLTPVEVYATDKFEVL